MLGDLPEKLRTPTHFWYAQPTHRGKNKVRKRAIHLEIL